MAPTENNPSPGGKGNRSQVYRTIGRHCEKLVASFEAAAQDFEAMAASHREAAKIK